MKRIRNGLTLIELIVVLAIIVIIAGLVLTFFGKGFVSKYYSTKGAGQYRCVKAYVVQKNGESYKRVDLQPVNGGTTETMECNDDWSAGVSNSATLYAQFEPNKFYTIEYVGYRDEGWNPYFPLVTNVSAISDPRK